MNLQVNVHVGNELEQSKEVVERVVAENIDNKMDSYLKKFDKPDMECVIDVKADKMSSPKEDNSKNTYKATLHAVLNGEEFHYEREDYEHLDHLINNLFKHLKESLSAK